MSNLNRREFLKVSAAFGVGAMAAGYPDHMRGISHALGKIAEGPLIRDVMKTLDAGSATHIRPQIRSEILENPKAVFIIKTSVRATKDGKGSFDSAGPQLEKTGYDVASAIFEKGNDRGGKTTINPNWTYIPPKLRHPTIGVTTAPQFVAGFHNGLSELGSTNNVVSERSAGSKFLEQAGHLDIVGAAGLHFIDAKYGKFNQYLKDELNWFKMKKGVVWKRVPVFRPHFDEDAFTINMPTLKCHNLGLTTLSIKNMQGFVPTGYGHYCDQWSQMHTMRPEMQKDLHGDYWQNVEEKFKEHKAQNWKYYDIENAYEPYQAEGGWEKFKKVRKDRRKADGFMKKAKARNLMWDEQWGQRTVDTLEVLKPDINIIEGVIGRDGDAFGNGEDYLTNYVVAGLDLVAVDTVGSYLMGHNPENLFYLKIANERGYGPISMEQIPLFEINGRSVEKVTDYTALERHRLAVDLHSRREDFRIF
ncbi:DUF362 domain-containing protein [Candidatus Latescibacterota bacterium]